MSNVLLIHGAWGGAWEFQDVVGGLARRGHRATAIDLPGHGQDATPVTEVTMEGFGDDATEIIHELSGGRQPREHIYFNVVHTVDGAWNLDGRAMSNEELGAAIAKG